MVSLTEQVLAALATSLLLALLFQTVRLRRLKLERAEPLGDGAHALHDVLTGLSGRNAFQAMLEREVARARRAEDLVGLAILDVNGLKLINDDLGLAAGDEVLRALAGRLLRNSRGSDALARLEGDRFALIIAGCNNLPDILSALYRLRVVWESPCRVDGAELEVSCSIGVSVFPDDAEGVTQLLGHAETALAKAKERGFNSLCIFDESFDRLARDRLARNQQLLHALGAGEFELYVQPQISLPDGRLTGAEGLVRWRHPTEGILTAASFIPLAERLGMMPDLSVWVIEECCRLNSSWARAGFAIVPLSVNVSARHFQGGDVPAVVAAALDRSGLDPRYLHLEITESTALHDVDRMIDQLGAIRALGVGLQLDDFGTGYSSLSYLLRYPLDVLKIDRSFVTDLPDDGQSRAIVKATLAMAKSLGLEVVAEGVETLTQLTCLVDLGCRYFQGFLFAEPMPCAQFEAVLREGRIELPERATA